MNVLTPTYRRPLSPAGDRLDPDLVRFAPGPSVPRSECQIMTIGGPKDAQLGSTYEEVCAIPAPPPRFRASTDKRRRGEPIQTYQPLAYATYIDACRDQFSTIFGESPTSEEFMLARRGNQMFGVMTWRSALLEELGGQYALALRGSLDSSFIYALGGGGRVTVCANGIFPRGAQVGHKCTMGMLDPDKEPNADGTGGNLAYRIRTEAEAAETNTVMLRENLMKLRDMECSDDRFSAYLGLLVWRYKFISPTLGNRAQRYWDACRAGKLHDEHNDGTMWSAYNAVTGGISGKASPFNAFKAHGGALHVARGIVDNGNAESMVPKMPDLRVE